MIRYYIHGGARAPEAVECEVEGYPHTDAKGRVQYDNSHYTNEAEAWEWLLRDSELGVKFAKDHVKRAEDALSAAREDLRSASVRRRSVMGRARTAGAR